MWWIDAAQQYKAKTSQIGVGRQAHIPHTANFQSLYLCDFDEIGEFFEYLTSILSFGALSKWKSACLEQLEFLLFNLLLGQHLHK